MPSLFSRRRAGSSASSRSAALDPTTSSSAALAASQAFIHRNPSTASLSSAAAAAALRSHTTSPEPIGNIQTKRMVRRGSQSSVGSGSVIGSVAPRGGGINPNGRPSSQLQRTNSNGSMTERTFRSRSPGGRANGSIPAAHDAPPVPAIPANIGKYRSSSVEPQQRVMSPTPQRGRRGASVDRSGQQQQQPPPSTPLATKRASTVNEPGSPSVNYSRPMSPSFGTAVSPTGAASKYTHSDGKWHTGASGAAADNNGQRAASGSAKAKIDRIMAGAGAARSSSAQGTRLSQAASGQGRPQSAQSNRSQESILVYDPNSRSFVQKPKQPQQAPSSPQYSTSKPDPGVWDPNTRSFVPRQNRSATASPVPPPAAAPAPLKPAKQRPIPIAVDTELEPPPKNPARYSPSSASPSSPRLDGLNRQPSVILEDPEKEATAETTLAARKKAVRTKSPPPATTQASQALERIVSLEVPGKSEGAGRGRNTSISPQRSARFSPSPVLEPTRHNPPPRDFSPAKSALKHSPSSSVRAASPMLTSFKSPPSEVSDTVSEVGSQDGTLTASGQKKMKSARVSFDEHAQAAPAASIVRAATPPTDDEEDAFMKPRPVLPSFGSVRKGGRVQPEPAEKVTEMPPKRNEASSSDHAIGGILKSSSAPQMNDPLPPEVTSKESAGYASDTSEEPEAVAAKPVVTSGVPAASTATELSTAQEPVVPVNLPDPAQLADAEVPAITLLPPTPGLDEETKRDLAETDDASVDPRSSMEIAMPGGWDAREADQAAQQSEQTSSSAVKDLGISIAPAQEAAVDTDPFPAQPTQHLGDIYEDESYDDAEFSDAAEDLSDFDDGGFASLDAIVQSPMVTPNKASKIKEVHETADEAANDNDVDTAASAAAVPKIVSSPTDQEVKDAAGPAVSDWSQATAYWSQLTKQQRRQMELEHLQSDDESRPSSVVAAKKAPKKKSEPAAAAVATGTAAATATTTATAAAAGNVTAAAKPSETKAQKPAQQQPLKPALKKSMRAQPGHSPAAGASSVDGVHMRQSMRSSGSMAKTMRGSGAPEPRTRPMSSSSAIGAAETRARPTSTASLPTSSANLAVTSARRPSVDSIGTPEPSHPRLRKKSLQQQRPVSSAGQPQTSARLAKELKSANDSDSESSFKKRRRARAGSASTVESQGRYSMKRSMRGGPAEPPPPLPTDRRPTSPTPSTSRGKGSLLRSLSPSGSLFGRNKMRDQPAASDSGRLTTLRGSSRGASSTSLRPSSAVAPAAPTRKYKSRFADSDDEDSDTPAAAGSRSGGGGGGFFRSRFADSDDDEPLTPVRGIPRRPGQADGDSTDLDDDSDDGYRRPGSSRRSKQAVPGVPTSAEIDKAMAAARRNLGLEDRKDLDVGSGAKSEGGALQAGTMRSSTQEASAPAVAPATVVATTTTAATTQQQQQPQPTPQVRPSLVTTPEKKRRSFMGSILRRNRGSTASIPQMPSSVVGTPSSAMATATAPAATQRPSSPTPAGSPAMPSSPLRGKLVRKNSNQPRPGAAVDTTSSPSTPIAAKTSTSATASPSTTIKLDSSNWPLPPPIPDDEPSFSAQFASATAGAGSDRPQTSDGLARSTSSARPNLAPRSVSGQVARSPSAGARVGSGTAAVNGLESAAGQPRTVRIMAGEEGSEPGERASDLLKKDAPAGGKKKKFGMLRRAFKLDD